MSILDDTFKEVERKLQFGCDKNYSDEQMVQMAESYKKRILKAKLKYYIKKIFKFLSQLLRFC